MPSPIVILKTGSAPPELAEARGDFDAWIADGLGARRAAVRTIEVTSDGPLPDLLYARAVLVTGSAAMVTDRAPWSTRTARYLLEVLDADVPLLAICYGHQLLADAMGGRVGDNPNGRQIGTVEITLREEAHDDPLFSFLPTRSSFQAIHQQSVLELPPGVRHLATSPRDPHAAFAVVGARAWGVQFHPEYDADVMRHYLRARAEIIRAEGGDPEALIESAHDTPFGPRFLSRFAELAGLTTAG